MVDATDLKSVEPEQLVRVRVSPPPLEIGFNAATTIEN